MKMKTNTRIVTFLTAFILLLTTTTTGQNSNNFEISKNLEIYATLFRELNKNYVDEISPGELMKTGIDAMLESLDPYTVYISEAEVEDYRFITTGQYGGIGALIHKKDDYVVISEPYENNPAQKAGLIAGDVLLEVDGKSVKGKSTGEVSTLLKGQPGTEVTLLIKREGMSEPFELDLERKNVSIDNVPYYSILKDNVGYIKLTGFTQEAGKEVKEAFNKLRSENELSGLILDLRGNGGGLLQEAVNVTNIFVDKGEMVVSTKGKMAIKNHTYRTTEAAVDTEIPVIVLVDNHSASASEIVAGALQDHDRAVIVGQTTFGKGLVQNVIPLAYNSQVKITVAKYYIPSGRCIQEIDYAHKDDNGNAPKIPDSLIMAYKTRNGRVVFDGHGIEPDVTIDLPSLSNIGYTLVSDFLIFDYASQFAREHDTIAPADSFEITDEIYNDFISFINEQGYEYTTRCEEALEKLKKSAEKENYFDEIESDFNALADKLAIIKTNDINKHEEEIKEILKIEIISRYYYQTGKIIASLASDKEIEKAIELFNERDSYLAILDGTQQKEKKETRN
ncbi:MAG: S41 family peptidase [Bacteroidetes bacterium]|nr:S41 family peptidase [Bacteroidota bacterium]